MALNEQLFVIRTVVKGRKRAIKVYLCVYVCLSVCNRENVLLGMTGGDLRGLVKSSIF